MSKFGGRGAREASNNSKHQSNNTENENGEVVQQWGRETKREKDGNDGKRKVENTPTQREQ